MSIPTARGERGGRRGKFCLLQSIGTLFAFDAAFAKLLWLLLAEAMNFLCCEIIISLTNRNYYLSDRD